MPARIRPLDHDLQPFQPLEPSRSLDPHLHHAVGAGGLARGSEYRQHRPARPPLCAWRKRGAQVQAIGRSRGGPTTKIHALTDGCGRAVAFTLGPGNGADISAAPALLDKMPASRRLLADRGYDAGSLRRRLAQAQTEAVIPSTRSRKLSIPYNTEACKARNLIERAFCRLKDWRRIATRYDKLAINFASAVAIAATIIWWCD